MLFNSSYRIIYKIYMNSNQTISQTVNNVISPVSQKQIYIQAKKRLSETKNSTGIQIEEFIFRPNQSIPIKL